MENHAFKQTKRKLTSEQDKYKPLSFRVGLADLSQLKDLTEGLDASRGAVLREIFTRGITSLENELVSKGVLVNQTI